MPLTFARPDLKAHEESVRENLREIVAGLAELIGKKLTAYVGGAKDAAVVERWIAGTEPDRDAEPRLRAAYHVVSFLAEYDEPAVIQAWLVGLNPQLEHQSPLYLFRKGEHQAVLSGALAFTTEG